MGLCKCPKRKVTNQFCYEHRVNVCEHCMITNHPKCVVLSYLKWLQDGDYNPICELCTKKLNEDECIRLVCYHVFHWHCLDNFARQMPGTIAPAGYTCPSCRSPMFPSPNLVSPVADVLRKKFESVNWARVGLGLSLLAEEHDLKSNLEADYHPSNSSYCADDSKTQFRTTIVEIESQNSNSFQNKFQDNVPRRLGHSNETKKLIPPLDDHDDNKYVRRSVSERFGRIHRYAARSKYFQFYFRHRYRRVCAVAVCLFIGFFIFMLILEKIGGQSDDETPEYDSMFNPHM